MAVFIYFREVVCKTVFSMTRTDKQYEKRDHQEVKTAAFCAAFYIGIYLDDPR
jgi:hypothetical protein